MSYDLIRQTVTFPNEAERGRQVVTFEGADVVPRRISIPDAEEFSELISIENDLQHVVRCCQSLIDSQTTPFQKKITEDSALIHYRRCFTSGVRNKLRLADVPDISDDLTVIHHDAIAIVDKFIAHSVNNLEQSAPVVLVHPRPDIEPIFACLSVRAASHGERMVVGVKRLSEKFLEIVDARKKLCEARIDLEIKSTSRDQLLQLPEFEMPVNLSGKKLERSRIR